MSKYEDLAAAFFLDYRPPEVDELTVGFSGIDPPLKANSAETDHEKLAGLLGGDFEGHYHLTKELWQYLVEMLNTREWDGGFPATTDEEYVVNTEYWFDGGLAETEDDEYEATEENWADGGGV